MFGWFRKKEKEIVVPKPTTFEGLVEGWEKDNLEQLEQRTDDLIAWSQKNYPDKTWVEHHPNQEQSDLFNKMLDVLQSKRDSRGYADAGFCAEANWWKD